jgi:predicted DNA binding CopG/RHH family protein
MEIPEFKSLEEEEAFWSGHSALDFIGQGEEVQIDASEAKATTQKRRSQLISLRISQHVLASIRRRAGLLGVPYQTLIQIWLAERLEEEARKAVCGRASARGARNRAPRTARRTTATPRTSASP